MILTLTLINVIRTSSVCVYSRVSILSDWRNRPVSLRDVALFQGDLGHKQTRLIAGIKAGGILNCCVRWTHYGRRERGIDIELLCTETNLNLRTTKASVDSGICILKRVEFINYWVLFVGFVFEYAFYVHYFICSHESASGFLLNVYFNFN